MSSLPGSQPAVSEGRMGEEASLRFVDIRIDTPGREGLTGTAPTAVGSTFCLLLNRGLLRYLYRMERERP